MAGKVIRIERLSPRDGAAKGRFEFKAKPQIFHSSPRNQQMTNFSGRSSQCVDACACIAFGAS